MVASYESVDAYVDSLPEPARERVAALRAHLFELVPGAEESVAYGMAAYHLPSGRPVFIAGWKAHVSLHAVTGLPDELEAEVAPYRGGRGTVKFLHRSPLPVELAGRIFTALATDTNS